MPSKFSNNRPLTVEDLQAARSHAVQRVVALLKEDAGYCEDYKSDTYIALDDDTIQMIGTMSAAVGMLTTEIKRLEAATFEQPPRRRPIRRRSNLRSW